MNVLGQCGEDRAEVEEFVLYAAERVGERHQVLGVIGCDAGCAVEEALAGGADERVEFIDGAVGFDTGIVLWNLLAPDQGCGAAITLLCVDLIDRDARLVEGPIARGIAGGARFGCVRHGRRVVGRTTVVVKTGALLCAQVDVRRAAMESAAPCE